MVGVRCQYGLQSHDGQRHGRDRTSAGFLTNSRCIATRLSATCFNTMGVKVHGHVILINGRAKAVQVYTPELCRAMCTGLMKQLEMDQTGQFIIAEFGPNGTEGSHHMMKRGRNITQQVQDRGRGERPRIGGSTGRRVRGRVGSSISEESPE